MSHVNKRFILITNMEKPFLFKEIYSVARISINYKTAFDFVLSVVYVNQLLTIVQTSHCEAKYLQFALNVQTIN